MKNNIVKIIRKYILLTLGWTLGIYIVIVGLIEGIKYMAYHIEDMINNWHITIIIPILVLCIIGNIIDMCAELNNK